MIRVAILGAGVGAQHLGGYRASPERFRPAAICDLDLARAEALAGGDPSIRLTADAQSIFADPEIDLVDVCLPPHLHFPMAKAALEAGKHVVVEKPMSRSLAEADALIEVARETGGAVFPVFQYRYGRATAALAALAEADLVGRPIVASLETHWRRDAGYYAEAPWRGTWAREAGGAVLSHAIHSHDLLCRFFGPVASLSASVATLVNDIETEDCAAISMAMENGALATSSITLGAADDRTRLRLVFSGLTAESGKAPYRPADDAWSFTAREADQARIDAVLAEPRAALAGFAGFLCAVADALDGRPNEAVTLEDGRRSIELVTAVYQSARTGVRATLPLGRDALHYHGWTPQ